MTPRRTAAGGQAGQDGSAGAGPVRSGPSGVSRQPVKVSGSPTWLPIVMFGLLALGIVIILLNYLSVFPGAPSNWYLLGGLGAILGGIVAATQYR